MTNTYAVTVITDGSSSSAVMPRTRKEAIAAAKSILDDVQNMPSILGVLVSEVNAQTWAAIDLPEFIGRRNNIPADHYLGYMRTKRQDEAYRRSIANGTFRDNR
jgi:hypothetical protein